MTNTIKLKRGSGSDPAASDMVVGEPVLRSDTAELFFKKDDGSVAKVSGGGGGGSSFQYLALRNAANDGAVSYPANDFTLVTSGTTTAVSPATANALILSYGGVVQKPNSGTSTSGITGFIVDGSRLKTATNFAAAPDFIVYQESGGIGEPSDNTVTEAKLNASNSPTNGYFLQAQSGNTGGLTWAAAPANDSSTGIDFDDNVKARWGTGNDGEIYFDGTDSIFTSAGKFRFKHGTDTAIKTLVDGGVYLSHDNSIKFYTTASGIFVGGHIDLDDNSELQIGTGDDLKIYHDGSHSRLVNSTGTLLLQSNDIFLKTQDSTEAYIICAANGAVELYYDNSKKIETTSSGVKFTGTTSHMNWLQGTNDDKLRFNDGVKTTFGNSDDLQIYFDGTNSFIKEPNSVAGQLIIDGYNGTDIRQGSTGEHMIRAIGGDRVELYYNGGKKFETISNGVKVNGTIDIYHDGSHSYLKNTSGIQFINGNTIYMRTEDSSEDYFRATQNGAVELYYDGSKKLETTSGGAKVTGFLNVTTGIHIPDGGNNDNSISIGSGNDLRLYHDGSNSYVKHDGGGSLLLIAEGSGEDVYIRANDDIYIQPQTNEDGIKVIGNGAVELYYDNAKKFETTSTGATVTGSLTATNDVIVFGSNEFYGYDNSKLVLGHGRDLQIYHNGSHSYVEQVGTGSLYLKNTTNSDHVIAWSHVGGDFRAYVNNGEPAIVAAANGAVKLYYNNFKTFETNSAGITLYGPEGQDCNIDMYADEGDDNADKWRIVASQGGVWYLKSFAPGSWDHMITATVNAGVQLYNDNVKRFETTTAGCLNTGYFKTTDHLYPNTDNAGIYCGLSNRRWNLVYAVNGTINTSDRNEKNTIVESDLGLDFVNKLKPVSYKWNKNDGKTHYGLIAQDVEETLSIEGKTDKDFAGLDIPKEGSMGLAYTELISPLIKAVQELTTKVETLETKLAALEGA